MAKSKKYKSDIVNKVYEKWLNDAIAFLTSSGGNIIKRAYEDSVTYRISDDDFDGIKNDVRKWADDTYNLHDSYGSAVYLNGILQDETIRYAGVELASDSPTNGGRKGRDVLNDYLRSESKIDNKHILRLVAVAAIKYAGNLERGESSFGETMSQYQVISLIADDMSTIAQPFGKFSDIDQIGIF